MEAGRELDALMAVEVMGVELKRGLQPHASEPNCWHVVPSYSTDIAAAWQVAEKFIRAGGAAWVEGDGHTGYRAGVTSEKGRFEAEADTAPLAICLAAREAVGHE